MRFFFDANFPIGLARAVREVSGNHRHEVIPHDLWFPEGTKDPRWIREVASREPKPFVVGGDGAILKRPAEAAALKESGLTYFILADRFPSLPIYEQASKFFKAWPGILSEATQLRRPTIFEISVNGKVEEKFATAELLVRRSQS